MECQRLLVWSPGLLEFYLQDASDSWFGVLGLWMRKWSARDFWCGALAICKFNWSASNFWFGVMGSEISTRLLGRSLVFNGETWSASNFGVGAAMTFGVESCALEEATSGKSQGKLNSCQKFEVDRPGFDSRGG